MQDLVEFCAWMYTQTRDPGSIWDYAKTAHLDADFFGAGIVDGNAENLIKVMTHDRSQLCRIQSPKEKQFTPRKILITSKDGYTDTSILALAYTVFAKCMTLEEAWLHLHCEQKRNFFLFDGQDMATMRALFKPLIAASPHSAMHKFQALTRPNTPWFDTNFSGNFPSRILPHLYLGNLQHANNFGMLRAIGVERVLSVGESPKWLKPTTGAGWLSSFGALQKSNLSADTAELPIIHMHVGKIQDNGVDTITEHIEPCLKFIDEGVRLGQATLVHCRVGVSRSASICIADVVRRLNLPLEHAYLFVRARRLNVIIQPNLLFMYELLRWAQEERSRLQGLPEGQLAPRSIEWTTLATKIAALNRFYIR